MVITSLFQKSVRGFPQEQLICWFQYSRQPTHETQTRVLPQRTRTEKASIRRSDIVTLQKNYLFWKYSEKKKEIWKVELQWKISFWSNNDLTRLNVRDVRILTNEVIV